MSPRPPQLGRPLGSALREARDMALNVKDRKPKLSVPVEPELPGQLDIFGNEVE